MLTRQPWTPPLPGASACLEASAVAALRREPPSGRDPQGWLLLLTQADSREGCPPPVPSPVPVSLPQAHARHFLA